MAGKVITYIILIVLISTLPAIGQIQITNPSQGNNQRFEQEERLASQYYRTKEYKKAAEIYSKLYRKSPSQYYYSYYMYCLLQLQDYDDAEKLAKKQFKKFPVKLKYLVDLGYIYQQQGETDKASREYNRAIRNLTPNIYHIKELANSFYMKGQTDKGIETYLHGREILDGEFSFRLELANMYKRGGNYDAMTDEFLDEIESNPASAEHIKNTLNIQLHDDAEGTFREYLWIALLKRSQKDPDNIEFVEMLLWMSIQSRDFGFAFTQAKSLDRRFAEDGSRIFDLGRLCLDNEDYQTAIKAFSYVMNKGQDNIFYLSSLIGKLKSEYLRLTSGFNYEDEDLLKLEKEYLEVLEVYGLYPETIQLIRDLAHLQAFYLGDLDEAIVILEQARQIPGVPGKLIAECKLDLADIYLFSDEVWEATLLYSQVEKSFPHEPIGHLAKLKNARLTYYIGEFEWAKAQLDVLKAATSKLIANDAMDLSLLIADNLDADSSTTGLMYFARADLLSYQNKDEIALTMLDSIYGVNLFHPLFDEVLLKKAEIMIKRKEYVAADSLLERLAVHFPFEILADDALFLRARLQEDYFMDNDKALAIYKQILLNYPGSLYTIEARKRFRKLRGDDI